MSTWPPKVQSKETYSVLTEASGAQLFEQLDKLIVVESCLSRVEHLLHYWCAWTDHIALVEERDSVVSGLGKFCTSIRRLCQRSAQELAHSWCTVR